MKKIFLILFLICFVFGNDLLRVKKYSLSKDETRKILVKYGSYQKLFQFRWTLYVNEGLVVFSSYDEMVSQHILYLNYQNQSFKIELKPRGAYERNTPYILVKFVKFDFAKHKALFEIWLYDKQQEVYLQYLE